MKKSVYHCPLGGSSLFESVFSESLSTTVHLESLSVTILWKGMVCMYAVCLECKIYASHFHTCRIHLGIFQPVIDIFLVILPSTTSVPESLRCGCLPRCSLRMSKIRSMDIRLKFFLGRDFDIGGLGAWISTYVFTVGVWRLCELSIRAKCFSNVKYKYANSSSDDLRLQPPARLFAWEFTGDVLVFHVMGSAIICSLHRAQSTYLSRVISILRPGSGVGRIVGQGNHCLFVWVFAADVYQNPLSGAPSSDFPGKARHGQQNTVTSDTASEPQDVVVKADVTKGKSIMQQTNFGVRHGQQPKSGFLGGNREDKISSKGEASALVEVGKIVRVTSMSLNDLLTLRLGGSKSKIDLDGPASNVAQ